MKSEDYPKTLTLVLILIQRICLSVYDFTSYILQQFLVGLY